MSSPAERATKILIVSESTFFRDLLKLMLSHHADVVFSATSVRDALTRIAENADLGLVLVDEQVRDGEGFALLKYLRSLEEPKPRAIVISEEPTPSAAERAAALGAIGFLGKPICFRDIAGALRRARRPAWNDGRALRRRTGGRARVLAPPRQGAPPNGHAQVYWYLRDVSATGAFLETESPVPVGARFELSIDLDGPTARVTAEVVRVQEPSWGFSGGVGVSFVQAASDAAQVLALHVDKASGDEY